jgi:hypothetical protein
MVPIEVRGTLARPGPYVDGLDHSAKTYLAHHLLTARLRLYHMTIAREATGERVAL